MKRKNPSTSSEAFYSLDPEQLVGLRKLIFKSLVEIGVGHYEDISLKAGIEPAQCWKRLSELEKFQMIHRTGERKMLSSKRMGFVWSPGASPEPVQKKERVMKGKTVAGYADSINKIKKTVLSEVKPLF